MDVDKALRELYAEKKRLDRAIVALEDSIKALAGRAPDRTRRGRKGMGPEERLRVSKRMSAYWATRRAQEHQLQTPESKSASSVDAERTQKVASA